jgi:hypothetical protein
LNILIDNKTVEQARNTDLIAFLEQLRGYTFTHRGSEYRCKEHPSLSVGENRLSWYWHSHGMGGFGAIDYLRKIESMGFRRAVETVTGIAPTVPLPCAENPIAASPKTLTLPEKAGVSLKLYAYLCNKRGIDGGIVNSLIQKETLYEDRRGNVVFVGHDEQGAARFACLRGTYGNFRGDCAGSDKRYGFHMTASVPSERLYIFESPIDAMSHASLENVVTGDPDAWTRHNRLSLSGTSDAALSFFLNQQTNIRELAFCLDNDPPGREAAVNMARKYADKGYKIRIELPTGKDFNEDLQALRAQIRAKKRTKPLQHNVEI